MNIISRFQEAYREAYMCGVRRQYADAYAIRALSTHNLKREKYYQLKILELNTKMSEMSPLEKIAFRKGVYDAMKRILERELITTSNLKLTR